MEKRPCGWHPHATRIKGTSHHKICRLGYRSSCIVGSFPHQTNDMPAPLNGLSFLNLSRKATSSGTTWKVGMHQVKDRTACFSLLKFTRLPQNKSVKRRTPQPTAKLCPPEDVVIQGGLLAALVRAV
jgi:hypothetical protein